MKKEDLFIFFEKLYFHEIEMREKLNARQQVPLAIIVAQITLIGFMINNLKKIDFSFIGIFFITLFIATIIFLFSSIYYFIRSWYNYEYSFLPSAKETDKYRNLLVETYKDYDDHNKLVENALKDYLYGYFIDCSTINTYNNDRRSLFFHKTATFLIASFLFSALTFVPFYFGNFNVELNNALYSSQTKGGNVMAKEQQKPPPPPAPPPKRLIREGVEITLPKPNKP